MTINQFTYMATSVRGRGVGGWGWLIKVYSPTHQWSLYQIKLQNRPLSHPISFILCPNSLIKISDL